MANHYHLLIETPNANLSIGMRQLNGILKVLTAGTNGLGTCFKVVSKRFR
jgi:putative transposase